MVASPASAASASGPEGPSTGPRPVGLSTGHFRRIAANGFGDPHNSYAYGYAWYRDNLFVGTNRDILVQARKRFKFSVPTAMWPVEVPESIDTFDLGAQIWRYNPRIDQWKQVFRSPYVPGLEGKTVPLASGFRNMAVFQGKSDPCPALYTIPSCGSYGIGPVLMRTLDGERFEQVSEQGLGLDDPNVTSFRSMVVFKNRLFMTPAGSRGFDPNVSYFALILCSDDPSRGNWKITNPGSFGDPTNYGIYDMCVRGDFLYAGTMNIREGFQLWKTDGEGEPPFHWTKVLDRGADRGPWNQGVVSINPFGDCVYLGTGIQNGGFDRNNNIGPGAGEVIRVWPDDTWDLVVGQPRMTRWGLKIPTSGMGPGWDNGFAGYIWRMCQHQGAFYVGTFDSTAMFPFAPLDERAQRVFDRHTQEQFMQFRGGTELWRTVDGDNWVPVTRNGFGNPYNWGIRTLISTPAGLFVGTANPFGPKVAVRGPSGWRYEFNPQGGVEVWHGNHDHVATQATPDHPAGVQIIPEPTLAGEQITPGEAALKMPEMGDDSLRVIDELIAAAPLSDVREDDDRPTHSLDTWSERPLDNRDFDPRLQLADQEQLEAFHEQVAAEIDDYFLGTRLRSVGYWRFEHWTPAEAARALVNEALAVATGDLAKDDTVDLLPRTGRTLAIGYGADELAAELHRLRPLLSIEPVELAGLVGQVSSLTGRPNWRLPAESAAVELVVWIDGPGEVDRFTALREVARVLRPGGCFVAADSVGPLLSELTEPLNAPQDIHQPAAPETLYAKALGKMGLTQIRIADCTRDGWMRFCRHSRNYFGVRFLMNQIDADRFRAICQALPCGRRMIEQQLLICAVKPGEVPEAPANSPTT
ncbi:MAG: hypothetical protein K1X74_04460 [Pirellulales bacterium]|nr:hypothetical protein [Pirellulales bacterium]